MKKSLLLILLSLLATGVFAQRNEIRVGYGVLTSNRILSGQTKSFGLDFSDAKISDPSTTGAISLSYRMKMLSKFRFGITAGYESVTGKYSYTYLGDNHVDTGKNRFWTMTADAQFSYLKLPSGIVELYWSASAGVGFNRQTIGDFGTHSRTRFAYQVVPLGISVGIPWVGVYAEAGFGYRGLLQLGAYVRF